MQDIRKNQLDPLKRGYDPMRDTDSPMRKARVEQLKSLYAERELSEVSPFVDGSADIEKFKENYIRQELGNDCR